MTNREKRTKEGCNPGSSIDDFIDLSKLPWMKYPMKLRKIESTRQQLRNQMGDFGARPDKRRFFPDQRERKTLGEQSWLRRSFSFDGIANNILESGRFRQSKEFPNHLASTQARPSQRSRSETSKRDLEIHA